VPVEHSMNLLERLIEREVWRAADTDSNGTS
jgi:hypothetical protein